MKPGKDLPKSVEALLKQAIEAQNKLCQDGMKLMQKPLGLRIIQDTFPTKKNTVMLWSCCCERSVRKG